MTTSRELAATKLGAPSCIGCLSLFHSSCAASRRVLDLVGHLLRDAADTDLTRRHKKATRAREWVARVTDAGFRREHERANFSLVARGKRSLIYKDPECSLPHDDHRDMWRKPHVGLLYVSQPYDLSDDHIAEMRAACARWGLELFASKEMSWWFPDRTTLVVIGKPAVLAAVGLDALSRGAEALRRLQDEVPFGDSTRQLNHEVTRLLEAAMAPRAAR